jgi:hypothetical protein
MLLNSGLFSLFNQEVYLVEHMHPTHPSNSSSENQILIREVHGKQPSTFYGQLMLSRLTTIQQKKQLET